MKNKRQALADLQLYIATSIVLALSSPALAQQTDSARSKSHEEHRAALDACREELGLPAPVQGERPQALDEETRAQMDACLKEKGFEPPKFGRGHGGRPPRQDSSSFSGVQ